MLYHYAYFFIALGYLLDALSNSYIICIQLVDGRRQFARPLLVLLSWVPITYILYISYSSITFSYISQEESGMRDLQQANLLVDTLQPLEEYVLVRPDSIPRNIIDDKILVTYKYPPIP